MRGARLANNAHKTEDKKMVTKLKSEPHIICLAAAKHYRISAVMKATAWVITLTKIGNRSDKFIAEGKTFWQAETMARMFLNSKEEK